MVRRLLAVCFLVSALVAMIPDIATAADTTTTTTVPVDQGDRSVIPAPNTGRPPEDAGDPGGWAQLTLFGLMALGCAVIFGRVLWAGHQRSRANRAH